MPPIRKSQKFVKEFASRLRAVRITTGYETTERFAEALGIKGQTYRRYERHEVMPPHEVLVEISRVTGFSVDWLLTGRPARDHPALQPQPSQLNGN